MVLVGNFDDSYIVTTVESNNLSISGGGDGELNDNELWIPAKTKRSDDNLYSYIDYCDQDAIDPSNVVNLAECVECILEHNAPDEKRNPLLEYQAADFPGAFFLMLMAYQIELLIKNINLLLRFLS
ncbi:hypothetical protein CASFOL_034641 [Castilleja foliolosa]|uniref:Uncharacterized protein n=1 Tax=Castilleja foliolosa TaxID=1961234 RepID=A0ABD3BRA2_9LAMI